MKSRKIFCLILIPLITIYIPNILAKVVKEPQATYAILHENGDEFLITDELPDQDKIVAGAHFTNAINQTGYEQKLMVLLNFSKQDFFFSSVGLILKFGPTGNSPILFKSKLPDFLKATWLMNLSTCPFWTHCRITAKEEMNTARSCEAIWPQTVNGLVKCAANWEKQAHFGIRYSKSN